MTYNTESEKLTALEIEYLLTQLPIKNPANLVIRTKFKIQLLKLQGEKINFRLIRALLKDVAEESLTLRS